MKQKIALYGFGYVGKAVYNLLKDHYEIKIFDPGFDGDGKVQNYDDMIDCELGIVCVPTPMGDGGAADLSIVEKTISEARQKYLLIKSTIVPGTTKRLQEMLNVNVPPYIHSLEKTLCFSPEYIGEGKYQVAWWKGYPHPTDMKYHSFQIFGGPREATNKFVELFQRVLGPDCQYWQTDSTTAELVKYMENSWGATKVIFCNEFAEIARAFGVDYRELRELFLLDGRVERMHTSVFEGKRGFGGKCYPKDVNAIVKAAEAAGYAPALLKQVLASNDEFIKKNVEQ